MDELYLSAVAGGKTVKSGGVVGRLEEEDSGENEQYRVRQNCEILPTFQILARHATVTK